MKKPCFSFSLMTICVTMISLFVYNSIVDHKETVLTAFGMGAAESTEKSSLHDSRIHVKIESMSSFIIDKWSNYSFNWNLKL